jgi:hypothetical protein
MKAILIQLLFTIMARYLGGKSMQRIAEWVEDVATDDVPSADKRQRVVAAAQNEIREFGNVAVNAAIELAVLKLRNEGKA